MTTDEWNRLFLMFSQEEDQLYFSFIYDEMIKNDKNNSS